MTNDWSKKYDYVGGLPRKPAVVKLNREHFFVDKKGNEYLDTDEDEAREQMKKRQFINSRFPSLPIIGIGLLNSNNVRVNCSIIYYMNRQSSFFVLE